MMRATENQGSDRILINCFYQTSNVKDLAVFQPSFRIETPMKPSQVPNQLSNAPPKRILPLSSPKPSCTSKPHLQGPAPSKPAIVHNSSGSSHFSISSDMAQVMSKEKDGSRHSNAQTTPGPSCTPRMVVPGSVNSDTSPITPQHPPRPDLFQPSTRQVHSISCHNQADQVIESQHALSNSQSKSGTTQRSAQCQQRGYKLSSEKSLSVVNSKFSSQKRSRESESGYEMNSKRPCLQSPNSGKKRDAHPTAANLPSTAVTSRLSTHSPCREQPVKAKDGPLYGKLSKDLTFSEQSSTLNPEPSHNSTLPPKHDTGMPLPRGAHQVMLFSTHNSILRLTSTSYRSPDNTCAEKTSEAIGKKRKLDALDTGKGPSKANRSSLHAELNRLPTEKDRNHKRKYDTNIPKSSSYTPSSTSVPPKAPQAQRLSANDVNEFFSPDPCIVKLPHKAAKTTTKERMHISPPSKKDCSSHTIVRPSTPRTECLKPKTKSSTSSNDNSPLLLHPSITKQAPSCSQTQERQVDGSNRKQMTGKDHMDSDLDLSPPLDSDSRNSSQSSEDEWLPSFREIMSSAKPPGTPDRSVFSEPSSPGTCSPLPKPLIISPEKLPVYKNSHSQMLKEINENKRANEEEMKFLSACQADLVRLSEFEVDEHNQPESISTKDNEYLQRYSLSLASINDVPPGEEVFNREKFHQIFDQHSLQLEQCDIPPGGIVQKTLWRSIPAQLRLLVTMGLFQEIFSDQLPCPTQVSDFLFKMMSVHRDLLVSDGILRALCDNACSAAYHKMKHGNQQFDVWVPSLADVTLTLMNMGASFVTLYPLENLQPPFTEKDLLKDHCFWTKGSSNEHRTTFPEQNCNNMLKYLSFCMHLCPQAYSDQELLLLLTVIARISLDSQLILQSTVNFHPLECQVINNFRDWDAMLPRICLALTDVTDDHHNMCQLVHLLSKTTRGMQLRQHLSLCMISKLLDGTCTYMPARTHLQLSELRPFIPRMRPSTLKAMLNPLGNGNEENTLDQQAYYLCYSLLTLTNEVPNLQFYSCQKEQLQLLSLDLEAHVKSNIRESAKCLYRSKVKDLQARISTKWEKFLKKTRPLNDQLYDWQPADTLMSSREMPERRESLEESVMEI